jgi:site-specific recombinase XerD
VFANKEGRPYRSARSAFRTACKNASLKGVTPHTLRHTFASRLVMAGVDLRTVQELGGWASLRMVERYSHLSPSHRAEAIERIASKNFTTLFTTPGEEQENVKPVTT